LLDSSPGRGIAVKLYSDHMVWRRGNAGPWYRQHAGHWADAPKASPDPKAAPGNDPIRAADWTTFSGRTALPEQLELNSLAAFNNNGVSTSGRHYIRTKRADFIDKDFKFELVFTQRIGNPNEIAFIGVGAADRNGNFNEPKDSVFLAIHPPNVLGGEVRFSNEPVVGPTIGKIGKAGTHRVTIEKKGDAVTFSVNIGNVDKSARDFEKVVPDIKKIGPFLTNTNTHIFFGGGGVYKQFRLVEKP
jgi:hypothetical protein